MFARIASRYDFANKLLSGGIDILWRRRLVWAVRTASPRRILDVATGSGDVAFALASGLPPGVQITGMDFCQPMLDEANHKRTDHARSTSIEFIQGDGLALPFADNAYDATTISFGLRNMADRLRCLNEMRRTLRPGGHLFILEFSQPEWYFRPFYYAYLKLIMPAVAGFVTGDKAAYDYLCGSIEIYPDRFAMNQEVLKAGFSSVQSHPMTGGIVALHHAIK